jgi:ankyrin repeat protein
MACKLSNFELVELLTTMPETFVDIEDSKGYTPLHFAAQTGNLKIIQHLCKNKEANPLIPNMSRQTPRDLSGDLAIKTYL